jgi:hypothetical protein
MPGTCDLRGLFIPFITHLHLSEDDVCRQGTVQPFKCLDFCVCMGEEDCQVLCLLPLPLPRVVRCRPVALDALDAALLLLVVGFGTFPWRQGGLGFWQFLSPGLSLLGGLACDNEGRRRGLCGCGAVVVE